LLIWLPWGAHWNEGVPGMERSVRFRNPEAVDESNAVFA
jgi:hypothetical protein